MNINLHVPDKIEIDNIIMQKMVFIYNALENGWDIKKNNEKYIFSKKHEGKKEVFLDSYLRQFLENNISIENLSS
uniref:Ryanodine receptor Ryr domain-containing protein n=1 Tax=viral metagenome TaxID=1070528 RepID=A0A6C0AZ97_9ZZZZ|tara:strand:- start:51992 stop:52216 length:225 start_codon:yes stop_codon:yes gene_type:complete